VSEYRGNDRSSNSRAPKDGWKPTGKGSGGKGSGGRGGKGKASGGKGAKSQKEQERLSAYNNKKREEESRSNHTGISTSDVVILEKEDIPCPLAEKCKFPLDCEYKHSKQFLSNIFRLKTVEAEKAHALAMETRVERAQHLASISGPLALMVAHQKPHISHGSPFPPGYDSSQIELEDGTFWKPDHNDKYAITDKQQEESQKLLDKAKAKEKNLAFAKATSNVGRPDREPKTGATQKGDKTKAGETPARDKRSETGAKDAPTRDKYVSR
jgi:hypothetical protein